MVKYVTYKFQTCIGNHHATIAIQKFKCWDNIECYSITNVDITRK